MVSKLPVRNQASAYAPIRVEHTFDGELTVYEGRALAQGHNRLSSEDGSGQASLHCFPGSAHLEGFWLEGGERDMWRIELRDPGST